ncbi:hypothetical protein [Streptosporangium saharense]|uniref:hypothetical protein n=1 Tax=Streptosporangium saharense TaxID=1706840 RepID=UPI00342574C4
MSLLKRLAATTSVAEELQEQAAVAIAAFVLRRKRTALVRANNVPSEASGDL